MLDAVPVEHQVVIVESAIDHTPQIFMGFTAAGSKGDLAKLQTEAKRVGLPAEPCAVDEGIGIMVAFPPSGQRNAELKFYKEALSGKFGKLRLELALMPVASAQKGRTLEDDGYAVDPEAL